MKLTEAIKGKRYLINGITLDKKVTTRLYVLGMTKNAEIEVLKVRKSGAIIIKVRGTRLAVGRELCEGIDIRRDRDE